METNETLIPIPGRLTAVAEGGHVAGADEIIDDNLNKTQEELNSERVLLSGYTVIDDRGTEQEHYDLNDLTTPGVYSITDTEKLGYFDNLPISSTGVIIVEKMRETEGHLRQTLKTNAGFTKYERYKDPSMDSWSTWRITSGYVSLLGGYRDIASWGTSENPYDLNNLTEAGCYYITYNSYSSRFTNRPNAGVDYAFMVQVSYLTNDTYIKQRFYYRNAQSNEINKNVLTYERYSLNSGSTWSNWILVQDDLVNYLLLSGGTMTGDIDLATNTCMLKMKTASSWVSSDRNIPFGKNASSGDIGYYADDFTYNPKTGVLKAGGKQMAKSEDLNAYALYAKYKSFSTDQSNQDQGSDLAPNQSVYYIYCNTNTSSARTVSFTTAYTFFDGSAATFSIPANTQKHVIIKAKSTGTEYIVFPIN